MRAKKNIPRVGIFMPAYNQGRYIHEAIKSLNQQTFQDFEVLIVDDGSTDGETPEILRSLDYPKAHVVHNSTNKGISIRTGQSLKRLKNEFLFILCADDMIEPTFIEESVTFLDKHPKHGAVATYIQEFGESDNLVELDPSRAKLPELLSNNHFLGSSMARRRAFSDIGFSATDPDFRKHYDYDRWVSMLEAGWQLGIIPKPLFRYRILSTSLSRSIDVDHEVNFRRAFIKKHRGLFDAHYDSVLIDLYRRHFESEKWLAELTKGHKWLDGQYHELTKRNKVLEREIARKDGELSALKHRLRYVIAVDKRLRHYQKKLSTLGKLK